MRSLCVGGFIECGRWFKICDRCEGAHTIDRKVREFSMSWFRCCSQSWQLWMCTFKSLQ